VSATLGESLRLPPGACSQGLSLRLALEAEGLDFYWQFPKSRGFSQGFWQSRGNLH
jgi:hypothetical protein